MCAQHIPVFALESKLVWLLYSQRWAPHQNLGRRMSRKDGLAVTSEEVRFLFALCIIGHDKLYMRGGMPTFLHRLLPLQVEVSCPKEMAWKVNMYRGYLAICHPEEQQLSFIERLVEMASSLAIREWRRLPHVVSHVHTPLLQVGLPPPLCALCSVQPAETVVPLILGLLGNLRSSLLKTLSQ
jgi:hypothetical protein